MAWKGRGAELRAGIVVVVGLAVLAGGVYWVSGGEDQFKDKSDYTVYFKNGGGVGEGDTVYLGGQKVGEVKGVDKVELTRDGKSRRYIAVGIQIFKKYEIPVNSTFTVSKTVTGIVSFNIDYGDSADVADEKTQLFGERLATFEEAIHKGSELLEDARGVVGEMQGLVKDVRVKIQDFDVKSAGQKVQALLDSLNRSANKVETILNDAQGPVGRTLKNAESATGHVDDLAAEVKKDWPEMSVRLRKVIDGMDETQAEIKGILRDNREPIKEFIQTLNDGAKRVGPALERMEKLTRNLDETVIELRPQVVKAVEKAKQAMGNFEALTEDLRTAPWKLINKPSDEESDDVHFYNASRLYVEAAARIGDTIQDLETLRRLGVLEDPKRAELVDKVLQLLNQSLTDFDKRQKELVDLMASRSANK